MNKRIVRIATRKSPLAIKQSEWVKAQIEKHHPDIHVELLGMMTQGDKLLATPLSKIGGKGLFVKELEHAIIERRADLAVHSIKDMPAQLPGGMLLSTICIREDPRDAFVSRKYQNFNELPEKSIVGTASLRRQCQLLHRRPDLIIKTLRGNVNTRLRKLEEQHYDAIILATAGLNRLDMSNKVTEHFAPEQLLPAVGQGAIGIECREDDQELHALLQPLADQSTAYCVAAERAMNKQLEGGCQVPIAGYAVLQENKLWLRGLVANLDGSVVLQSELTGSVDKAEQIGQQVAIDLLDQGADKILQEVYGK